MNDGFYCIAAATPAIAPSLPMQNADILSKIANRCNSGIIAFPALSLCGATLKEMNYDSGLQNNTNFALAEFCKETKNSGAIILLGTLLSLPEGVYNAVAVIFKGEIYGIISGTGLTIQYAPQLININNKEIPFSSNLLFSIEQQPKISFSAVSGEDFYSGFGRIRDAAAAGASIVFLQTTDRYYLESEVHKRLSLSALSKELAITIVYVGAGGSEASSDYIYAADNFAVQNGKLICCAKLFENGVIKAVADCGAAQYIRQKKSVNITGEYLKVYIPQPVIKTELISPIEKDPFIPKSAYPTAGMVVKAGAAGLVKRILHTKSKCLIIGLSGGLDSAMALVICVYAAEIAKLPLTAIMAYSLPCFGSSNRTKNNSRLLASALGVTFEEVDITDTVKSHLRDIRHSGKVADIAFENAQARVRTMFLLNKANMQDGLVIGTGDLSETALGFCTFGGDSIYGYGVNGSLPKTLIRSVLRETAKSSTKKELQKVLLDIIDTPISPELLPTDNNSVSQPTEKIVGPYELHDFFLYHFYINGSRGKKLLRLAGQAFKDDYSQDEIEKWLKVFTSRFYASQYKRNCSPDGVCITECSLSPRGGFSLPGDIPSGFSSI